MIDLAERYEHFRRRFRKAMDDRNLTNEVMADRLGAHSVTVSKLRSGKLKFTDEWRFKAAAALDIAEDVLFGDGILPAPRPFEMFRQRRRGPRPSAAAVLPVYGLAAGSIQGASRVATDPIDEVPCPPGLANVLGAYVMETRGDSMVPRYGPKDRLYINPVQDVRPGDHVVIQVETHDRAGIETWVKRFDGQDANTIWVSQYNPPARMDFIRRYVRYMHRILPVNELWP